MLLLQSFLYTQVPTQASSRLQERCNRLTPAKNFRDLNFIDFTAEEMQKVATPKDSPTGGKGVLLAPAEAKD